jgi:hypothetical protein
MTTPLHKPQVISQAFHQPNDPHFQDQNQPTVIHHTIINQPKSTRIIRIIT